MNTTLTPKTPNMFSQNERFTKRPTGPRCMLWVDGVGGFLTCFSGELRLGQAVTGAGVDIPIIGDLSRHHVSLTRQSDAYLLQPLAPTWVDGCRLKSPHVLADGDEIRLGDTFEFRFRQPHALSVSARLDFLSHHRTQPSADGVLLVAGSCIMGPKINSHVVCQHWEHEVVLVRQGQKLACHTNGNFEVDGAPAKGRAPVTLESRIQGDDFCLSLERLH